MYVLVFLKVAGEMFKLDKSMFTNRRIFFKLGVGFPKHWHLANSVWKNAS